MVSSRESALNRPLTYAMVGGGRDAFIGAVHRMAAALDGSAQFVAGALSSSPDKAIASGKDLGLADDRNYPTWQALLEGELKRSEDDRIDFVSIVTPNHTHYEIARAFADAGINVILDKPMVHTSEQAADLVETVQRTGVVFAVTYNYSGYPMVKQARSMVGGGELGEIRKVIVEYNQGWLATNLEATGQKQADWRTDPARSGIGGAVGDIGSHAEQLVSYVTGLEIDSLCSDLTSFIEGRRLDDDANMLLRFSNGARGILWASQIEVGEGNNFRLRVYGETGGLEWHQENPNHLLVKRGDKPDQTFHRGTGYVDPAIGVRLPVGHPEAFIEAFATIYRNACNAIRAGQGGPDAGDFDYPDVTHGARGVRFIEKAVESSNSDRKWTAW